MGFFVSLNGCSLKSKENLAAASAVPLDRLMLETDAPWCPMKRTHASAVHLETLPDSLKEIFLPISSKSFSDDKMLKGRNEPCTVGAVAWVIATLKGISIEDVMDAAWKNTSGVFGLDEPLEMTSPVDTTVPGQ